MIFIDANIFLRAILRDDQEKAENCLNFLDKIDKGEIEAATSFLVLNEILWVLEGLEIEKQEIVKRLKSIASSKVKILNNASSDCVLEALHLYEELGVDFIDALNACAARENKIEKVVSYDEHFDRISFVERIEPQEV